MGMEKCLYQDVLETKQLSDGKLQIRQISEGKRYCLYHTGGKQAGFFTDPTQLMSLAEYKFAFGRIDSLNELESLKAEYNCMVEEPVKQPNFSVFL